MIYDWERDISQKETDAIFMHVFRSEWKKILSGNLGGPLTLKMIEVGLAPYIGLPKDPNVGEMEKVWNDIQVSFPFIFILTKESIKRLSIELVKLMPYQLELNNQWLGTN